MKKWLKKNKGLLEMEHPKFLDSCVKDIGKWLQKNEGLIDYEKDKPDFSEVLDELADWVEFDESKNVECKEHNAKTYHTCNGKWRRGE